MFATTGAGPNPNFMINVGDLGAAVGVSRPSTCGGSVVPVLANTMAGSFAATPKVTNIRRPNRRTKPAAREHHSASHLGSGHPPLRGEDSRVTACRRRLSLVPMRPSASLTRRLRAGARDCWLRVGDADSPRPRSPGGHTPHQLDEQVSAPASHTTNSTDSTAQNPLPTYRATFNATATRPEAEIGVSERILGWLASTPNKPGASNSG